MFRVWLFLNPSPAEVLVLTVIRVAALLTVVCISLAPCSFVLFRVSALKAVKPECEASAEAITGSYSIFIFLS